jgi:toxin FitB
VTYPLDTNILSETRKRQPATSLTNWITATPPERLHVSVLTLGEIEQGISHIRGRGDHEQAASLERWLREMELGFADTILPITLPVASAWRRQQQRADEQAAAGRRRRERVGRPATLRRASEPNYQSG